jgi:hypothetical protein
MSNPGAHSRSHAALTEPHPDQLQRSGDPVLRLEQSNHWRREAGWHLASVTSYAESRTRLVTGCGCAVSPTAGVDSGRLPAVFVSLES